MSDISVDRKITFQTFGKPGAEARDKNTEVMKIIGYSDRYKIDSGTYGEYPVIYGDFMAISHDGKKARAGKLIVPMFVFDQFRTALEDGQTRVEIGFNVSTKPSPKGNKGYEWVITPLFAPKAEDDRLLMLAARVEGTKHVKVEKAKAEA